MPFIDTEFQIIEKQPPKVVLFISIDYDKDAKLSLEYAHTKAQDGFKVLWIDGNVGISDNKKINTNLDKVLSDKAAIPKAIRKSKDIFVLSGSTNTPLIHKSQRYQHQFLSDLQLTMDHFDQTVIFVKAVQKDLLTLWSSIAECTYLILHSDHLYLEKVVQLLQTNIKCDGIIPKMESVDNAQWTWLRLKELCPNTSKLILDIKKIAP